MKAEFYIKFKGKKKYAGIYMLGAPKTSTKKPSVAHNEVCVKMEIDCEITKEGQMSLATQAKSMIEKKLGISCEIHA